MQDLVAAHSVLDRLRSAADQSGLTVRGGALRRTSSRICLGVEHGDYNGTPLFGVGIDRFLWLAYRPCPSDRVRLFSINYPEEGVVEFRIGQAPAPGSLSHGWARFPFGVDFILRRSGFRLTRGYEGVIASDIPGGGMSRSASLTLNLMHTVLEVNAITPPDAMTMVDLAQAVETDYIGSPCGKLDPIMISFARRGMGTYYDPDGGQIAHIPLGASASDFRLLSLDTGTTRAGLENSTYVTRRKECEQFVELACDEFAIRHLADVKDRALYDRLVQRFGSSHPDQCRRLKYIFDAQQRLPMLLDAWQTGDLTTLGDVFRRDGWGLRDDYAISGPELETMCDLVRTVPGVLGERMLGGGDRGAAGCLVRTDAIETVKTAVEWGYPRSHPQYAHAYSVHVCQFADGIVRGRGL